MYVGKLPNLAATRIITPGRIIADEGKSPHLKKNQGGEMLLFGLDTIFVGDPCKLKPSLATVLLGVGASDPIYLSFVTPVFLVDCQPFFRHDTFIPRVVCHQLTFPSHYFIYMSFQVCPGVKKNRAGPNWWSFQTENSPKESCMCLK